MSITRPLFCLLQLAFCVLVASCAARRLTLPTDPGATLPDFASIHTQLSGACRTVRTFTAELSLAGRAGDDRLRGQVHAGFERPASMRLEGVAPFGPPAFVLAAREGAAVLLLPRDERVLRGARPEDVLGALTGIALGPADVMAILSGCVVPDPSATGGRLHENGWASIELQDGATVYARRVAQTWQLTAARRSGWQIEYSVWYGAFPQVVALRSLEQTTRVDVTATIRQFEANSAIDRKAFTVDVPPKVRDLTLDELRAVGPLRGQ